MSHCTKIYKNSVKEGIGDSCGYTSKVDLTCITTCYHHLLIIFYSLSISLEDLHVCTGSGIKRSSNVWDGEKNATAPWRMRTAAKTLQRPQATIVSGGWWWGWDEKIHPLFLTFFFLFYLQLIVTTHGRDGRLSFCYFCLFGNHTHANTNSDEPKHLGT